MKEVVCNSAEKCDRAGLCLSSMPHAYREGLCDTPCVWHSEWLAKCQPVPTDLFDPLRRPEWAKEGLVTCDVGGECGVQCGGHKRDHKPKYSCDKRHYCANARCMVRCNPVPEPTLLFTLKGKIDDICNQIQEMIADDKRADALRVQGEANGDGVAEVYWYDVRDIILGVLDDHDVLRSLDLANRLATRIVKLPRP